MTFCLFQGRSQSVVLEGRLRRGSLEAFQSVIFAFNPDGFVSGDLNGAGLLAFSFFDEFSQGIDHFAFSAFSQITKPES